MNQRRSKPSRPRQAPPWFRYVWILVFLVGLFGTSIRSSNAWSHPTPQTSNYPASNETPNDLGLTTLSADALPGGSTEAKPYELSAAFILERGGNQGSVRVVANLAPGYHIYAIPSPTSQTAFKTEIRSLSTNVRLSAFQPSSSPEVSNSLPGLEGIEVHWHSDQVIWTAPFTVTKLAATPKANLDIRPEHGSQPNRDLPNEIRLAIQAQICNESCLPIDEEIIATFAGFYEAPVLESQNPSPANSVAAERVSYQESEAMVRWEVGPSKSVVVAGEQLHIVLAAYPEPGFHLYAYEPTKVDVTSETLIVLDDLQGISQGSIHVKDLVSNSTVTQTPENGQYQGNVEWTIPLTIPQSMAEGQYFISGLVGYQACSDEQCDQPRGIQFSIPISVGSQVSPQHSSQISQTTSASPHNVSTGSTSSGTTIRSVLYKQVAEHPSRLSWHSRSNLAQPAVEVLSAKQIGTAFCLALIGGLLLNFMPCVLPVIGLKILGFVSEGAGDRKTTSVLTFVYSLGMIGVILTIGICSLAARELTGMAFGWGEHFGWLGFRIVSTAFMFALALSFLGVWEIPIPGFATSQTATRLSKRQGYFGALNKGIITTLLATPCSAPYLGSALVVALTQPAWIVLLIFFAGGLGMALPYLILSLQPKLLDFLPKPGPWMQTFKEFLAFPMLLAVVMFVNGFSGEQKIAMLASLIFLWFGCWVIGRVPAWSSFSAKSGAWAIASIVTVLGTWGSFHWVRPSLHALNWVPYNEPQLQELVQDGKTVLLDFTADWCLNCKQNLSSAIHTPSVKQMVEKSGVVAMEADLTDYPAYIKKKLAQLGSVSIPLVAIYPGDDRPPIILRDRITESEVLDALRKAASSKSVESATIGTLKSAELTSLPLAEDFREMAY